MPFTPSPHPGILHHYAPKLVAFEHTPHSISSTAQTPQNTLLFIGGLSDGLLTVHYPSTLSRTLPPTWSVAEVLLSSAYTGWTTSTLARDADELALAVAYFRSRVPGKLVLMGHSTGCQIAMEYVVGPWAEARIPEATLRRAGVDGVILQAGISDREGLLMGMSRGAYDASVEVARGYVSEGRPDEVMPAGSVGEGFGTRPTARRWLSLASPDGRGEDDYFSSDLPDERLERTFGRGGVRGRGVSLLVLLGGEDEHMPEYVDRAALVERWRGFAGREVMDEDSGVVLGASHNLNRSSDAAVKELCDRVDRFLGRVVGGREKRDSEGKL